VVSSVTIGFITKTNFISGLKPNPGLKPNLKQDQINWVRDIVSQWAMRAKSCTRTQFVQCTFHKWTYSPDLCTSYKLKLDDFFLKKVHNIAIGSKAAAVRDFWEESKEAKAPPAISGMSKALKQLISKT